MTAIEAAARALRDLWNDDKLWIGFGVPMDFGFGIAALFRALDSPPVAPPIPKCPDCGEPFEVGHGIAWFCLVCGMVWKPGEPLAAKEPKR